MTISTATATAREITGSHSIASEDFGLAATFELWFDAVQRHGDASNSTEVQPENEIYVGSFPGSNFEVVFEGILHFDGHSIGNISSPDGTLVLTNRGKVEADIDVGTAIINGLVFGTITASERVVLESEAKVIGQIVAPALTIRLGAVFDGDCLFTSTIKPRSNVEKSSAELEEVNDLLVGV